MSGYVLKAADASVVYLIDWRRGYLAPGERLMRDLGWSIQPQVPTGAPLTVSEQGHDRDSSWAAFAGGAPGRAYMVTNCVRTNDERVLRRAIVVRVASGVRPQ